MPQLIEARSGEKYLLAAVDKHIADIEQARRAELPSSTPRNDTQQVSA